MKIIHENEEGTYRVTVSLGHDPNGWSRVVFRGEARKTVEAEWGTSRYFDFPLRAVPRLLLAIIEVSGSAPPARRRPGGAPEPALELGEHLAAEGGRKS